VRCGLILRGMSNDRFAVSVKDAAGAYVRANDAFTNLLGVSPADLPGLTDEQVQPRDVAETLVANDRSALSASGTLLVEEPVFDRLGLRKVAACRFVTEEDGRTLVWRVSGVPALAAEVAAEAERLRLAVTAGVPVEVPAAEPPVAAALDDAVARIGRLEAELAEARSEAALPDPRTQAALRAVTGVAEALEHPLRVAPAFRAAAERLGSALGFDAAVTWRPARDGGLACSSVWTANPDGRAFEDACWRTRRAPLEELTWNPDAAEPHGMRTVVTVPIGEAGAMELLAVDRREPETETLQALDAAARQLRIVARLTELADLPRWASIAGNATT
jgi:PAS domain-containing protein